MRELELKIALEKLIAAVRTHADELKEWEGYDIGSEFREAADEAEAALKRIFKQ